MTEVNDALIAHLSDLARLQFDETQRGEIKKDLEGMIGFVDKLMELDTEGVEPLVHLTPNVNMFREDLVCQPLEIHEVLKNAAFHDGTFFKVPKVIKK
ncbi:MAG TPA: Asp-tRNA(Asn)/Glu-tRNA(Gln) amidotransferase subunit GatC [Chitinophagaceae bacterium]|nr:Asp-tRNA(Asn)/Glu-tRNA(Gln) amidotransferase subunit GatC [Chitinophagaceae bacterium]